MTNPLRALFLAAVLVAGWITPPPPQGLEAYYLNVQRVVDGDTLLMSDGSRVRLIGVDTPEVHPSKKLNSDAARTKKDRKTIQALGKRSSEEVKKLVENKSVRLEFDPANAHHSHRDRYGRLLAYVFLDPTNLEDTAAHYPKDVKNSKAYKQGCLNGLIILTGYGQAYTKYPFERMEEFRTYQKDARENARGLWGNRD